MPRWPNRTRDERFDALSVPVTESGCFIWSGAMSPKGYGYFAPSTGRCVFAHRYAYERANGPVPDGLELDHLCRVRCCVNPDHMEAVDHLTNVRRGDNAAKRAIRQTVCKWGHDWIPENIYISPTHGRKRCIPCRKLSAKEAWRNRHLVAQEDVEGA